MNKITDVENAIIQLGSAEFQKFCDTILSKTGKYGHILSLGMKGGTLKTTKGNPDTYFRKENGKYVFVAYSTQQKDIFNKIKEDIEKCLDEKKTKLPISEIDEIIVCHTSSNLLAGDDYKLHQLCENNNIKLTILGVDELAQQVCKNMPSLVKDFLGISLDTNQIFSLDDFVSVYDANKMAAPLDTEFFGRKEELTEIISALKEYKVIVVHGTAGVGKTRLVLQAVREFVFTNDYVVRCIRNNNQPLYNDLSSCLEEPGNYIIFIDDANELTELLNVVQYITKEEYDIKIIMTVRDYAKEKIVKDIYKYVTPHLVSIKAFSDEDIKVFIDIALGIKNSAYYEQIIRVSEGNPRIAYMAGKIAVESQNPRILNNVSQVYEQYYEPILEPQIGDERDLYVSLGIISFVGAVFLNKLEKLKDFLFIMGLSEEDFREHIYHLSSLEMVDIHQNLVVNISDQCLSNYMLYCVFFKKKYVALSGIIRIAFKQFRESLIRSINTIFNVFYDNSLKEYVAEEVCKVWDEFKQAEERCFEDFVVVFHMFRPEDALIMSRDLIARIPQSDIQYIKIDYDDNTSVTREKKTLSLLADYKYSSYLSIALQLFVQYAGKSPENAVEGFRFFITEYGINPESFNNSFMAENSICESLLEQVDSNYYAQVFILAVVSNYLSFSFRSTELGRGNSLQLFHFEIENYKGVKQYRQLCWEILLQMSKYPELSNEIENIIKKYAGSVRGANVSVALDDKPYIEKTISLLNIIGIRKALIRRDLEYAWKRLQIPFKHEKKLFQTKEWRIYSVLEDDFIYSELEYGEYEKKHDEEIAQYVSEMTIPDIKEFVCISNKIVEDSFMSKKKDIHYTVSSGIERIERYMGNDIEKAKCLFVSLMDYGSNLNVSPKILLDSMFKTMESEEIYNLINNRQFNDKSQWNYYFFSSIPTEKVNDRIFELLLSYLGDTENYKSLRFFDVRFLDKYKAYDKNIFVNASKIICEQGINEERLGNMYFALFHERNYNPEKVLENFADDKCLLKNIYFSLLKSKGLIDLHGSFLLYFLRQDEDWINRYSAYLIESVRTSHERECYRFNTLWNSDNYNDIFDYIFDKIIELSDSASIYNWELSNIIKQMLANSSLNKNIKDHQEDWIIRTINNCVQDKKIVLLFSVLSEMDTSIRKRALLEYVHLNKSYEAFEKIALDSDNWGGNTDEIIPQLKRRIDYLESLLLEFSGVDYLDHIRRIKNRIDFWKNIIKQEELQAIIRKLYQ